MAALNTAISVWGLDRRQRRIDRRAGRGRRPERCRPWRRRQHLQGAG